MNCCTHDCNQGRGCQVRVNRLLQAELDALTTPLITGNSDASSAHDTDDLIDDTGLLMLQGIALLSFVVSAVLYASLYFP